MYQHKTVTVVLPTYNEADSIRRVIQEFEKLDVVDEVLVINNNAARGTSEEVSFTSAREIFEPKQGYGAAIRRGLTEAQADLICICEPDGTFDPEDLLKLLAFTRECEFVVGSRTVSAFIWNGANMGLLLRWGNWVVAKLIEVLYNTAYLSDVGCTFRVVSSRCVNDIEPYFTRDGSSFGLEMLMLSLIRRDSVVQIPVNYRARVGTSSVTGDLRKTLQLGAEMISMVLRMRVRKRPRRRVLRQI